MARRHPATGHLAVASAERGRVMSAELLREAAALMRERAKAATPGPWSEVREGESLGCLAVVAGSDDELDVAPAVIPTNAAHIASWHPGVALAVADWLDREADGMDLIAATTRVAIEIGGELTMQHSTHEEALTVARAYLGRGES